jgi:predicted ribosome quality control (RQC) complex YloA/Tae2 family protein
VTLSPEQIRLLEQELESERRRLATLLVRRRKALIHKKEKLQLLLEKYNSWELLKHEGLLLQANFHKLKQGQESIDVEDWAEDGQVRSIQLDSSLTPQEQVAKRFQRSKKWRRGINPTNEQLLLYQNLTKGIDELLDKVNGATTIDELASIDQEWALSRVSPTKTKENVQRGRRLPYRTFKSATGWDILVGRTAKDNDLLSFRVAKGNDYWMHVSDYPGSHVVLRPPKRGMEPDEETLQDALQLALHYSKATSDSAEVHLTQAKALRRPKHGKPGQVLLTAHRSRSVVSDSSRLANIRKRSGQEHPA